MRDPHTEYFQLLAGCLAAPPGPELLAALARRAGAPELGAAHPDLAAGWEAIAGFLGERSPDRALAAAEEAHRRLLGDPLSPVLDPYASRYLGGTRVGPALAAFRGFLREWDLVPQPGRVPDLEDHAAFQFDCLARLCELAEEDPERWGRARQACLRDHLLPWLPRFLGDLGREARAAADGGFYAGLARVGLGVLELEAAGLG